MFFDSYYGIGGSAILQLLLGLGRTAARRAVPVPLDVHPFIGLRQR